MEQQSSVQRYLLRVSYDGARYHGWQKQRSADTVQGCLEHALSRFSGHDIRTVCAGRTDAGVHALAQVVHFDTQVVRPLSAWVKGVNAFLPPDIVIHHSACVDRDFHARFSAVQRHYVYVLSCTPIRPSLFRYHMGWVYHSLDIESMKEAAALMVGEHDFSAFRSAHCQATNPVRQLTRLEIRQTHTMILFYFSANAFLHHMIRNIVGCLIMVGRGIHPPHWLSFLLRMRSRTLAAPTFMPCGLYLTHIEYPERYAHHTAVKEHEGEYAGFPLLYGCL